MRLATKGSGTQESFEILSDKSPTGLCIVQDGKFCYTNSALQNITGYGKDELLGMDSLELIIVEDKDMVRRNTLKAMSGECVLPFQFRVKHKDCSIKWVVESAITIQYGGRWAALANLMDITDRKRAEEMVEAGSTVIAPVDAEQNAVACPERTRGVAGQRQAEERLWDAEEKLQRILESATDAISIIDLKAVVTEANQRAVEMYRFRSRNELLGESVFELFVLREHSRLAANLEKAVEDGAIRGIECTLQRADGSEFPGELSINTFNDAKGDLLGHILIVRDITRESEIDGVLKRAAEEWSRTFDSINDAVCIIGKDFRLVRVNKAFADMYHLEPGQAIGKYCYEVTGEGKEAIEGCPHLETLRTEKSAKAEFFLRERGAYVEISTSPIFDDRGEIVGSVHITRDITEQKEQNERLMSTDRLASLGELAAGTAHEFNNPLTSVIGLSELLMQREVPDDVREDLKIINNEAQRAANVARNLLAFGAKHAPSRQPDQINSVIEDVLELRAYEHKQKNIDIDKRLAPDLPKITVDYFQMQQVFMNIIINAEYFMIEAHGGGTLTIASKKHNDIVRISVGDDGPGIPPENLSRIFDPFFTTKQAGKGTGLGLSICHSIVTEHGGHIYVDSQLGRGTTIFVDLPVGDHEHEWGRPETA
jgi:PAS domain S-box-containing protein